MGKNAKAAVAQQDRNTKRAEKGTKESKKSHNKPVKVVKEPTPESSEDEEESVDEEMPDADDTSESSESSESEAEAKPAAKVNGTSKKATAAVNGDAKAIAKGKSGDESDEESEDDSEEESEDVDEESESEDKAAPPVKSAADLSASDPKKQKSQEEESGSESESDEDVDFKAAPPKKFEADASGESSEEDDDGSDSEDDEDEKSKPDGPVDAGALHGALKNISSKEESESSGSEESGSEESSEEEEEEKKPAPKNKRKAEEDPAPAPKKSRVESRGKSGNPPSINLFVGNLSWNVDDEWLGRTFEKYGEIKNAWIKYDRETNKHKGFGFVEFVDMDAAVAAYEAMNEDDAQIDGRKPNVDYGKPEGGQNKSNPKERAQKYGDQLSEPSNVVFIGNTSFNSTQDSISEAFAEFGEIQSVRLPTDRDTGALKGFAFVEYATIEEATAAIKAMTGQYVDGRPIRLDFTSPRAGGGGGGGGDNRRFSGGDRGGFGGRGRGGRGGRGDRGGGRGDRGGGRGGFRGGPPKNEFKGNKITF